MIRPAEQEQIVAILTQLYEAMRAIELEYTLFIGEGDFRPRIEYFHDAVRAFTSGDPRHIENGGRLNVEFLAYDLACLRYIQSKPLVPFKPQGGMQSPGAALVAIDQTPVPQTKRPDRKTREALVEHYQKYAVLFSALLKPAADTDHHERVGDLDNDVRDLNAIIRQCEKGYLAQAGELVQYLEDPALRAALAAMLRQPKAKDPASIKKIVAMLKDRIKAKDKAIKAIENAHRDYGLAQLTLFENSRDMLKKMAAAGMNLVGNFVAASIAQTRREMGR